MTGMEYAIEQVANALHGDQCAEDPDPGERCNCGADDFYRQAEIVLDTLREVGVLAPAPLREEWTTLIPPHYSYTAIDTWDEREDAYLYGDESRIVRRYISDWEPCEEGD